MLKYVVTRIVKTASLEDIKSKSFVQQSRRLLNKTIHLSILRRFVLLVKITL